MISLSNFSKSMGLNGKLWVICILGINRIDRSQEYRNGIEAYISKLPGEEVTKLQWV